MSELNLGEPAAAAPVIIHPRTGPGSAGVERLSPPSTYRLSAGDTLAVTVFRIPELSREVEVELDGRISFPPLGRISVDGMTLEEASQRLGVMLEDEQVLSGNSVTVALVRARPFFVGGDVAAPGAFPYRSDMTVRRAIALAGGIGAARERRPELLPELRGERELAELDLFRERLRLAGVEAQMAGRIEITPPVDPESLGPGAAEVLALEQRKLLAALSDMTQERGHLERNVTLVSDRIRTLTQQAKVQNDLMESQGKEIDRMKQIQDRGLAATSRVTDERRAFESMQERAAATAAEIASVQMSLEAARYELDRFDDRRRDALGSERQGALLAAAAMESRLRAIDQKLAQIGVASDSAAEVTIFRRKDGREDAIMARDDMILEPGDFIEVRIDLSTLRSFPGAAAAVGQ